MVYNCNCEAPQKGEKYHRKECASWLNASPRKRKLLQKKYLGYEGKEVIEIKTLRSMLPKALFYLICFCLGYILGKLGF